MTDTQRPLPPHNIELEQALLGALLVNNEAFHQVSAFVEPRHFFEPVHQKIFEVASGLIGAGKVATPVTLKGFFASGQTVAGLPLAVYLGRLSAEATAVLMASDYGRAIVDLASRREAIRIAEMLIEQAHDPGAQSVHAIAADAVDAFAELVTAGEHEHSMRTLGAAAVEFVEHVAALYQGTVEPDLIPSGLADLDERAAMKRGSLVILAGRPGMGKTTLAGAIALNAAKARAGVALFSLEMPAQELVPRIVSDRLFDETPIPTHRLTKAKISPEEFDSIVDVCRGFEHLPLWLDDTPRTTVGRLYAKAQAIARRFERQNRRLDLIVIDYLKFIGASDRYAGQRHLEIGEVTASLKQLARRMNCVVVLCAQLNRDVEHRQDRRPQLSDLRESGDIEADADLVLLLFREAYYLQTDPDLQTDEKKARRLEEVQHQLEIIVAKNRHGAVMTVPVFIDLGFSAVRNLAKQNALDLRGPS